MKNLKKLLAVVLVIAMAFSLMAVASAAKLSDFDDADSVTHTEGAEVMTALGIMVGGDGSNWDPTGTFTREMAAKVICYIMTPSAKYLTTSTSRFSDVEATRWSAPFIEYCASKGIIHGTGDGTFAPTAPITASAFAKLLLGALGYGRNDEFIGSNWEINTIDQAIALGILTLDVNYSAAATREQIAQYALNALTNNIKVWDKNTEEYVNAAGTPAPTLAGKMGLVKDEGITENGVTGYKWKLGYTYITGLYSSENVVGTSTNGATIVDLSTTGPFDLNYIAPLAAEVTYFRNGYQVPEYVDGLVVDTGDYVSLNNVLYIATADILDTDVVAAFDGKTDPVTIASGNVVKFFDNNFDGKVEKISLTVKTFGTAHAAPQVNNVTKKVTITGLGIFDVAKVDYPADLAAGDVVLRYTDAAGVTHIEKAAKITGTATSYKAGTPDKITINGTAYAESGLADVIYNGTNGFAENDANFNVALTAYLDDNGDIFMIFTDESVTATSKYAVILNAAYESDIWSNEKALAKLLFTDGTTKIVTVADIDEVIADVETVNDDIENDLVAALQAGAHKFHTYTVTPADTYVLTTVATGTPTGVTLGAPTDASVAPGKAVFATGYVGNANTVFIGGNEQLGGAPGTYKAITGIANVPGFDSAGVGADMQIITVGGVAQYVYISAGAPLGAATTTAYVSFTNKADFNYYPAVGANAAYYVFTAIVDGDVTTVKVAVDQKGSVDNKLFSVTYTSGVITAMTAVTVETDVKTAPAAGGVIVLGDPAQAFTYNSATQVFYIDGYGTVTPATIADVQADADDVWFVQLSQAPGETDLIDTLYIYVK